MNGKVGVFVDVGGVAVEDVGGDGGGNGEGTGEEGGVDLLPPTEKGLSPKGLFRSALRGGFP